MDNKTVIWITIAVYVVVLMAIGLITGRKSKSLADLTVGGRNAGAWLSALSYGTAYFSAVMFVGYAGGTGWKYGLWGIAAGVGNAVFGSWLAWKMLARRTRDVSYRMKIKTMPQLFERRFSSKKMKLFACIVIFIFLVPYSASVYMGLASIFEVLLGINATISMVIIAVVAMLLLLLGGYLVQARADFIQGLVMMVGVTLLIIFTIRCDKVGGFQGIAEYAKTAVGLPKLNGSMAIALISTVLMTSFGTWGLPQMVQKYYGIKDDKQAKRGIAISTFFALLVAGGGYFIGSLSHMFMSEMPAKGQDYIIPTMLQDINLAPVLLGIVLVLLIAASVSTLCSVTLTASSTLSMDFIKEKSKRGMSDKKVSTLTKVLCVIFIIGSYAIANTDTPILDMMSYSWGIISGSFLAPYVVSLYWKGVNKFGAWAAMVSGFVVAVIPAASKIIQIIAGNPTVEGGFLGLVNQLAGYGPQFACLSMLISLGMIFLVSALTKNSKEISKEDTDFFYEGVVEQE